VRETAFHEPAVQPQLIAGGDRERRQLISYVNFFAAAS
jgi:hypothetical protein